MNRTQAGVGAILGFLGVGLGAFATHGLRGTVSASDLEVFQTAAHYQLIHAVAILAIAVFQAQDSSPRIKLAGNLIIVGVIIFSGTLYGIGVGGPKLLGAVTPIGGICLLAGWALVAWSMLSREPPTIPRE